MKKFNSNLFKSFGIAAALFGSATVNAQMTFDPTIDTEIETPLLNSEVIMPISPIKSQILFIGGVDTVQTTATYGNSAGQTLAKQWHDFIGITPDTVNDGEYWISVNHEMISADSMIGDGGGMSVFKVEADAEGMMTVKPQTLSDGRSGKFFNVDFVNTVGETGMNCGGINSGVDGRIWTAEEWFRTSNASLGSMRDTSDWTVSTDLPGDINGTTISKYQNFNWFVEIDPREAVAIRKQYNWGRLGYEGGAIADDNKTVYMGHDGTPGFFTKFVADVAGDFTQGTFYVYKQDAQEKWVEINNEVFDNMLYMEDTAVAHAATIFNRLEWVAIDPNSGKVYMTETGRDNPASRWNDELAEGGVLADHHNDRATAQGVTADSSAYWDYYGRILQYDPSTMEVTVFLEAGPAYTSDANGVAAANYPDIHLSNPDGLNFLNIDNHSYMVICEDLNGTSYNRMPYGFTNRTCEMFLLDMDDAVDATTEDLKRILVGTYGSEITGAVATPDGKTLLVNVQHPKDDQMINTYPYNNSLTIALYGWKDGISTLMEEEDDLEKKESFSIYPNPATRELRFNKTTDVGIYDVTGKLVQVERNVRFVNVSNLEAGSYFVKSAEGETRKVIIK